MTSWEIDVDFVDFSIRSFPRFRRFGAKLRLRWCPWRFESHQQGSQLDITGSVLFYIFSTVSAMKELNYIHFSLKALTKEDKKTKVTKGVDATHFLQSLCSRPDQPSAHCSCGSLHFGRYVNPQCLALSCCADSERWSFHFTRIISWSFHPMWCWK